MMRRPAAEGGLHRRLEDLCTPPQTSGNIPVLMVPTELLRLIKAGHLKEVLFLARCFCSRNQHVLPKKLNQYKPFFPDWPSQAWMASLCGSEHHDPAQDCDRPVALTQRAVRGLARDLTDWAPRIAPPIAEDDDDQEPDRTDEFKLRRHVASLRSWADAMEAKKSESRVGGGAQYSAKSMVAALRFCRFF